MARQTKSKSKGKTALKKTGKALKGFAQGALSSASQILGAGAEALNPTKRRGRNSARLSSTQWANEMARLRDIKPRPLNKLYGKQGPTPEQEARWKDAMREWNRQYRHASKMQRITLEEDNAAFRARQAQNKTKKKRAKRNASRTVATSKTAKRRSVASSKTGHSKTARRVRSVAKARKASTRRASNKTLKKSSRVGKRRNASSKVITKRITTYRTRPIGQYLFSGGMEYFYDGHDGRMAGYKTLAETKAAIDKEAQWWADYYKSRGVKIKPPRNAPRRGRKNPSAKSIRKDFAGSVNGERDLFFPQGTPAGKLAKLGKLVSITTEEGTIKPVSGSAWLCADTKGKLHIGSVSGAPLFDGPARSFGHVTKLEYESSKPHLGYRGPIIWFHKAGEENGIRPTLRADGKGGLVFRGGDYRLTRRGIEN